jgi:trehalose synthase
VLEPFPVDVPARPVDRLMRLIGPERAGAMGVAAQAALHALGTATIWNISSTAHGGGVAEMLEYVLGYAKAMGVDTRWMVIQGDAEFFAITKRLHNRLHGAPGDGGDLGPREAAHYRAVLLENAASLERLGIRPGDIVFMHDPQTAGLAGHLRACGARLIWRCHIGSDTANSWTDEAWAFLAPHLAECRTFVFSHAAFVPALLAERDLWIIEPSIDPFSDKNRALPERRVRALLAGIGLIEGEHDPAVQAIVGGARPFPADVPLVVQVSRWDRLKDMGGVMEGFAGHVVAHGQARLALVGPAVAAVSDDPDGARVLAECTAVWEQLPAKARDRIRLVTLPMDDVVANALMVNAAQRHASVVVQKSLAEGFGLTVTEAMWKARAVVASAVGGIVDQMPDGTGVLLKDPTDLTAFGTTLAELLSDPRRMHSLGRRARRHVKDHLLSDRHLRDYARVVEHMAKR